MIGIIAAIIIGGIIIAAGIRIVRPTHRAVIEHLGKYKRYQESGITWIVPFVEKQISINITEQMTEALEQEIITKDNLNAKVDAQVYFKVKPDEKSVKASLYNVYNYSHQIVALAQTSLRNVIGDKMFSEVNSQRNILNAAIAELIQKQTESWGIEIVRVELKQIVPPKEVQETMNMVIQANNKKTANIDFATAAETEADGIRRAQVKQAEGIKASQILKAEGEAQAIKTVADATAYQTKVVNEAAQNYFKDNAITLKNLEVTQASLENNTKVILSKDGISPVIVLGETGKIVPIKEQKTI